MANRGNKKRQRKTGLASLDIWLEVAGILLLAMALVTVLSLLSFSRGTLTSSWIHFLRQVAGWGAYVLPLGLGALGFWLFLFGFGREIRVPLETGLGVLLLFLGSLGLSHCFAHDPQAAAMNGVGGGYLGWVISKALIDSLGYIGAILALLTTIVIGLIATFSISMANIARRLLAWGQKFMDWYRHLRLVRAERAIPSSHESLPDRLSALLRKGMPQKKEPVRIEEKRTIPQAAKPTPTERDLLFPRIVGEMQEWQLPHIEEILDKGTEQELSQAEIRTRARIIEETLANFGVPAKVVEVNPGPTVTQFGIEPGFIEKPDRSGELKRVKVKVNRISALANDLALALAASPIRIEAPVPGRSLVGIEVPNTSMSLVSLRSVMDSDAFRNVHSKLRIALGQDVAGQPVVADLAQMPHLLIAGATGSGKSVCINSITACLLLNNTPDDLRLVMVDPKMVELTNFNGIPHLLFPVVVEIERVVATLKWVTGEMDRRYRVFSKVGARNIDVYNQMQAEQGAQQLPYIVVLIDELADLMMVAPDEIERYICRIAQLARATGIHLVIATQRPSVDVVTGLIKANFPARIS
ncbi:MAG: DNA translocase FtsK 4TM domain-containing protein, partial [Anaerolineae bacterium]